MLLSQRDIHEPKRKKKDDSQSGKDLNNKIKENKFANRLKKKINK